MAVRPIGPVVRRCDINRLGTRGGDFGHVELAVPVSHDEPMRVVFPNDAVDELVIISPHFRHPSTNQAHSPAARAEFESGFLLEFGKVRRRSQPVGLKAGKITSVVASNQREQAFSPRSFGRELEVTRKQISIPPTQFIVREIAD